MSDYCPHGVGMKYPCTQCKDAELAEAKTALEIARGINTMRHELTDPGAQERRMERIADRMRAEEHKETLGIEISKALNVASKLEAANVELDKMGVLLADKHNTISALRAELAEAKTYVNELHGCLSAMTNRWEPDTEGLDRVMWENAQEALGRDIWDRLKTT